MNFSADQPNRVLVLSLLLLSLGSSLSSSAQSEFRALFNGKNLAGWYTYQRRPEPTSKVDGLKMENGQYLEPIGLNRDPLGVFTVVEHNCESVIRISGEVFGILVTDEVFGNYHLMLEFKYGERKYPPRDNSKRDSGILYHSFGPEAARGGVWMKSVECQIQEGDTGDLWCVEGTTAQVDATKDGSGKLKYDPSSTPKTFDSHDVRYCQRSMDYEKPYGEWNTVEIYTYENESIHVVNGQKNMHLKNIQYFEDDKSGPLTKGKIQLQSEGAEIFFRKIQIRAISEIPNL